jgi:hypothetical protein
MINDFERITDERDIISLNNKSKALGVKPMEAIKFSIQSNIEHYRAIIGELDNEIGVIYILNNGDLRVASNKANNQVKPFDAYALPIGLKEGLNSADISKEFEVVVQHYGDLCDKKDVDVNLSIGELICAMPEFLNLEIISTNQGIGGTPYLLFTAKNQKGEVVDVNDYTQVQWKNTTYEQLPAALNESGMGYVTDNILTGSVVTSCDITAVESLLKPCKIRVIFAIDGVITRLSNWATIL